MLELTAATPATRPGQPGGFATTQPQPGGYEKVTDIPARGFYWTTAISGLLFVVLAWAVIKYAVLSALRRHTKETKPKP